MDEDFENLSISSSDEWAILDENSEYKPGITDIFCSICGVELDQILYKKAYCPFCFVCQNCYQNYSSTSFVPKCEHSKEKSSGLPAGIHGLPNSQTPLSSVGSSLSENNVLVYQPLPEPNVSEQTSVEEGDTVTKNGKSLSRNGHTKLDREEDFPHQSAALPISSSPRLIPSLSGFHASVEPESAYRRCSLSWSECSGSVCASSTDSDHQEVVVVPTAGLEPTILDKPTATDDLTARLASFELASSYARCAVPKPMPTIAPAGRPVTGSPPATSFFTLGNLVRCQSPPPSPPSPLSSTCSSSPMNSAARFLKSVVKHSATTLNNFDFLPMHPWDGEAGFPVKRGPRSPGLGLPQEKSAAQNTLVTPTQMAADPLMSSVKKHTLDDEKLRALLTPKTIPKCVFEASAYNLR